MANIGWLYYKDYYRELGEFYLGGDRDNIAQRYFRSKNKGISEKKINDLEPYWIQLSELEESGFSLQVIYPGLSTGLGMAHSSGLKEESKLGFTFDHTSGLPFIPASSVKGCIRAIFPQRILGSKNEKISTEVQNAYEEILFHLLELDKSDAEERLKNWYTLARD